MSLIYSDLVRAKRLILVLMVLTVVLRPFWNVTINDVSIKSQLASTLNIDSEKKNTDLNKSTKNQLLLKTKMKYLNPKALKPASPTISVYQKNEPIQEELKLDLRERLISLKGVSPPSVDKSITHLSTLGDLTFAFKSISVPDWTITI